MANGYASQARHGSHPVLDMQRGLNNGAVAEPSNLFSEVGGFIDNTPRVVAAAIVISALTLFFLGRAGFRFNFGVGANVGK
jgi:hypothetical protein